MYRFNKEQKPKWRSYEDVAKVFNDFGYGDNVCGDILCG